jgi:hypothetical protein
MPTAGYASTTNLGVQLQALRSRLGEPYDDATEDTGGNEGYYTQLELIEFIYQAELRLAKDLVNDALVGLHTTVSRTTTDGVATYDLPTTDITVADDPPVLRMVGVDLDTGAGLFPCRQISRKDLWKADDWGTHRAEPRHPIMVYDAAGQITVRPTPTTAGGVGAGKLVFRYLKVPRRRFRHHRGIVNSVTSTTVFIDADAGALYSNGHWTTDTKSAVRIVVGGLTGEERMIASFIGSTGAYTVAFGFSQQINVNDEYIAGEISEIGDHVGDMTLAWASYLGKQKIGESQEAQNYLAEYQSGVKSINELYAGTRGGHVEVVAP